jgi:arylsulfatase A-like enzyme
VDTLRADRLKLYNRRSRVSTRHLEHLAETSTVFERATAQGNWTKSSVATILTGVHPLNHGAYTHKSILPRSLTTQPVHFKSNGMRTAGFVANGYISNRFGFERGWDTFELYPQEGKPSRAAYVLKDVVSWMKRRSLSDRFFAYVHTVDPHAPYAPRKRFWSRYDTSNYRGIVKPWNSASLLNRIKAGGLMLGRLDIRRLNALYNGEITYHDEVFGYLLREMKKLGIFEDTVVIITSDHGEEFLDHGSVGHGHSLYEELLHVPFIIRLPDSAQPRARRVQAEVGLVDLFPTLCDLLDLTCPASIQGRSLAPLLLDESGSEEGGVSIAEFPNARQFAVRTKRFKAVFRGFDMRLADMRSPKEETVDVSADHPIVRMAMADTLGGHLSRLEQWRATQPDAGDQRREGPSTELDADTQYRLRALGYLGD